MMKPAIRGSENPFFKKGKYADLADVAEACREPLSSNGLSVSQGTERGDGDAIHLDTLLMHSSGQWIMTTITMVPVKADPQGIGSCLTYARRYSLAAICGVAPDDDDDGNAASGKKVEAKGFQQESVRLSDETRDHLEQAKKNREKLEELYVRRGKEGRDAQPKGNTREGIEGSRESSAGAQPNDRGPGLGQGGTQGQ